MEQMADIIINSTVPFVIGRSFDTRDAKIKQNAEATADMKAGTLLAPDADGKLEPCVSGDSPTYPVAVLIADVAKADLIAGDVTTGVVFNAMVNKAYVATVNSGLTIDETFIWEAIKNGLDIREMV